MEVPTIPSVQEIMKDKNVWLFLGGVVVGAAAITILGSKTARDIAVAGVAEGMKIRDDAVSALNSLQEDARDLYTEKQLEEGEEICVCECEEITPVKPAKKE